MMETRGPWKVKSKTCKYEDEHICVELDDVIQPDGKPGQYALVDLKPGVSVLPLDGQGNVFLVRQFRFGLGAESLEAVAGGMDEGEPPLEAAQREAREELGIVARDWLDLGKIEIDTSIVHSPGYLYLARELSFTQKERDGTERDLITVKISLEEAVRKVMEGEILHAPSAVLILKAAMQLKPFEM